MKKNRLTTIIAPAALLAATVIWGVAFVVVKNQVNVMGATYILAFRFTVATIFLALIFIPKMKLMTKKTWLHGLIVGALLFGAYFFQTVGQKYTTAGNSAFLTSFYVVLVPLLYALIFRKKPDLLDVICAVAALIGIGLISLSSLSLNSGDGLTLVCGVFFALHIIALSRFTKTDDVCLLTMLQFLFAAAISWLIAPIYDGAIDLQVLILPDTVLSLLFLGVLSSGVAFLFQSFGQKYTKAATSAMLLSTESVFGALAGWLWGGESISPWFVAGAIIMLAALIAGQTRLSFIPPIGKFLAKKDRPPKAETLSSANAEIIPENKDGNDGEKND